MLRLFSSEIHLSCNVILVSDAEHCEIYIFIFIYIKVLSSLLSDGAVFKYNVLYICIPTLIICLTPWKESYDQPRQHIKK